jgi:mono/diheme cytochrome c family protein
MSSWLKGVACAALGSLLYAAASGPSAPPAETRAFLDRNCVACHGADEARRAAWT